MFETLANILNPVKLGADLGKSVGGKAFPSPQKNTVIPSVVSNSPYAGKSPVNRTSSAPDAPTLSAGWLSWWGKVREEGRKKWDQVKGYYMGKQVEKLSQKGTTTLFNVLNSGVNAAVNTLTGLIERENKIITIPYDGETTQAEGSQGAKRVTDFQLPPGYLRPETAVTPAGGLFDVLTRSSKGDYNLEYMEDTPIETSAISSPMSGEEGFYSSPSGGGMGAASLILPVAIFGVIIYLLSRS